MCSRTVVEDAVVRAVEAVDEVEDLAATDAEGLQWGALPAGQQHSSTQRGGAERGEAASDSLE